jgi:AraC-like DNA-binding protein
MPLKLVTSRYFNWFYCFVGMMTKVQSSIEEGTVRVGASLGILEVLKQFDVDPIELLQEAGIDPEIFSSPDNRVPFSFRTRLIQTCSEKTGCPHFGLLVGQKGNLASLGLIGYVAINCHNVESALRSLINYFYVQSQGSVVSLSVEGDQALFRYTALNADTPGINHIHDAAVAMMLNIMRQLFYPDWRPVEVCFAHKKPLDISPYRQFFRTALRFDAGVNGLYFPASMLNKTIKTADSELLRILRKQIDQLELDFEDDFARQVRQLLCTAFYAGHNSAEEVASLFSIHTRTLHRRLKECGTSFREISDSCRFDIAKQLLQNSSVDLIRIAEMVNYADVRTFSRAFERWSGLTPTQWRKRNC